MSRKPAKLGGLPPPGQKKARTPIRLREDFERIEFDLATGKSIRKIANTYGVHEQALYRHRRKLPPTLRAAYLAQALAPGVSLEELKITESEGILKTLAVQHARLFMEQDRAIENENGALVATLSNSITRITELIAKYLGELDAHSVQTVVSVLISPEYLKLRNRLIKALAPFPDARRAVAEVLHSEEGGEAARISAPKVIDVTPTEPSHEQEQQ
jgi:transposase-like protein